MSSGRRWPLGTSTCVNASRPTPPHGRQAVGLLCWLFTAAPLRGAKSGPRGGRRCRQVGGPSPAPAGPRLRPTCASAETPPAPRLSAQLARCGGGAPPPRCRHICHSATGQTHGCHGRCSVAEVAGRKRGGGGKGGGPAARPKTMLLRWFLEGDAPPSQNFFSAASSKLCNGFRSR